MAAMTSRENQQLVRATFHMPSPQQLVKASVTHFFVKLTFQSECLKNKQNVDDTESSLLNFSIDIRKYFLFNQSVILKTYLLVKDKFF